MKKARAADVEEIPENATGGRLWSLVGRLVLLLAVLVSAASPILVYDTDLWYHLRHARQLVETGSLVDSTDFSYLEPARPFTNYYWLFQVLVFGVFSVAGFGGLIALRTAIWALLLWGVDQLLRGGRPVTDWPVTDRLRSTAGQAWLAVLPALVAGVLMERALNLRPHLLSYTCLVLLLVAFERRRAPIWAVAVGVLWSNVHGVAYPVLWAIVGCYGLETLLGLRRGGADRPKDLRRVAVLTATGLSMLVTPHFLSLLPVPFRSTEHASRIIGELQPFDVHSLLEVDLSALWGPQAFTIYVWLLIAVLVSRLWLSADRDLGDAAWRPRLAHMLLLAAGIGLIAKAGRLHIELTLLALPLLRDALRAGGEGASNSKIKHPIRMAGVVAAALLLALGLGFLNRTSQGLALPHPLFDARPEQAASGHGPSGGPSRLPIGAAAFVGSHGPDSGRVLQQADYGGYWMWALEERYLIHMDLELPFAFSSMDYFELSQGLYDAASLDALLRRHQPDFVAVDARPAGFAERLRTVAPRFVPVFVDDVVVLWVDGARHPQLSARWRLESFDAARALTDASYSPPPAARDELLRLREVAPEVRLPHRLLAMQGLAAGEPGAALEHAGDLIAVAPERAGSWLVFGDALMANRRPDAAKAAFESALDLTPEGERRAIHRRLAYVELALERPESAYSHLRRAVDIDVARGSLRDLELLAKLAEQVGEKEHAAQIRAVLELRQSRRSSSMASP